MACFMSRPDSYERRVRLMAFSGLIGAPLIWLLALQTGYVLAYQACDDGSRSWVAVPTLLALAAATITLSVSLVARRRAREAHEPQQLLVKLGVGLAAMMVIVLIASLVAPLMLQPCD
jgi:membrane protein YdbS with pleckstrin-like domain